MRAKLKSPSDRQKGDRAIQKRNVPFEAKDFKPTAKMYEWFKSATNPEIKSNILAIEKDCGIDRRYWYEWRKDPKFMTWWNEEWVNFHKSATWILDKIGLDRARKDFKYWEAMQMKYGGLKKTVDVQNTGEPFSAGIFVGIDFKQQLKEPEVELRVADAQRIEPKTLGVHPKTTIKRATRGLKRTKPKKRTANLSPFISNDLDASQLVKEVKAEKVITEMKPYPPFKEQKLTPNNHVDDIFPDLEALDIEEMPTLE